MKPPKLGTAIEKMVKPVGQALNLPCYDTQGNLRPESGCAQRRNAMNDWSEDVYDFFFEKIKRRKEQNDRRSD